ncbi:Uncharacterised protein [uncultured archaeon]|nr:Uncharacterised protein [uncultured archaeon]
MSLDELVKYLIWIGFFILALVGLFFMLKKIGVL